MSAALDVRCARCPQMLCACVSLCLRSVGRSPSCAKMRRAKYRTQVIVSAEKRKSTESSVFIVEVVTETCSTAIVTEGQSRATDGARPNNASIVACKLFDLQGEFKFGVRKKRKNTNKVRAYLFVVRSPRLELGRCNHTPLKRTRLPIPP